MIENFNELYYYDESSPSCLRFKINIYAGKTKSILKALAGQQVGGRSHGYWITKRKGKMLFVHRVIWELHFGTIKEGFCVDHMDGNRSNNKISNLRVLSKDTNTRNCKKRVDNKTGMNGVVLFQSEHSHGYQAIWNENGRRRSKLFSFKNYSEQESFRLACEFRAAKILTLNANGAGYTERHGT